MWKNITTIFNGISIIFLGIASYFNTQIIKRISNRQQEDKVQCLKDKQSLYRTVKVVTDVDRKTVLLFLLKAYAMESKVESLQKDVTKLKKQVKKYRKLLKINHG